MLATWDPVAAVPTLRELTRICRSAMPGPNNGHDWTNQNLAVSIARFTLARDKAGDTEAIREYAEWIRTTSPDWLEQNALAVLEPFYRRPDDPTLAATAAWLFGDPQSPWVPLIGRKGSRPTYHVAELIASPMVEVPAFRKMLLAALDDRSPAGTAKVGDNGSRERRDPRRLLDGPDRTQGRPRPAGPGNRGADPDVRLLRLAARDAPRRTRLQPLLARVATQCRPGGDRRLPEAQRATLDAYRLRCARTGAAPARARPEREASGSRPPGNWCGTGGATVY